MSGAQEGDAGGAPAAGGQLTLKDKLNLLIDSAHQAGRGPYSNAEVAALVERAAGEQVSGTQIWIGRRPAARRRSRWARTLSRDDFGGGRLAGGFGRVGIGGSSGYM